MNDIQDAVTLALDAAHRRLMDAQEAVVRYTGTGRYDEWRAALDERTAAEAALAELMAQVQK